MAYCLHNQKSFKFLAVSMKHEQTKFFFKIKKIQIFEIGFAIFYKTYELTQTQYKINELGFLTCLIKWIGLKLIYIVLYLCLNTNQTRFVNMIQTHHKFSRL